MPVNINNQPNMLYIVIHATDAAIKYGKPIYVFQHPTDDTWQANPICMAGVSYIQIMPDGTSSLHCETCEFHAADKDKETK
jgi:hypothetical protein